MAPRRGAGDGPAPDREGGRASEPEGLKGPFAGPPTCGSAAPTPASAGFGLGQDLGG